MNSKSINGSLRKEAEEEGVPILLYEAGEALHLHEESIDIGVKGVVNVLIENGMLTNKIQENYVKSPLVLKNSKWISSIRSGLITINKDLGDHIKKGEVIASITEPLMDDVSLEVLAPYDAIIIGKSESPLVQAGDVILHIAKYKKVT